MKIQFVHAHFDDYEFTAAGLFERCRQRDGAGFLGEVVVCTDGKAGHHFRTREETGRLRLAEQRESARIGGYAFHQLLLPDGTPPREACLRVDIPLLAALWQAIRRFAPDYLICPPFLADPLAGIHVDHQAVAEAVRQVAYMINVPHAFTPEYPADETRSQPCKVPVILNAYDDYLKRSNTFDLAVEVEDAFETICRTSWCHQSQISEWLPWVSAPVSRPVPPDLAAWRQMLRAGFQAKNAAFGIDSEQAFEFYTVTSWGSPADVDALLVDLPGLSRRHSRLDQLRRRLG
ncbi:MAG: PIG-L family deacetylase [Caulobacterales bacterium]|nr:PIG-L family deacetylase [Caulobacterales bacterium]